MPILQATLKASLMARPSVEMALAEPQFEGLDDRLKTELLTRMANLQAAPQPSGSTRRSQSSPWSWLVILLVAAGLASFVINLSLRSRPRSVAESRAPGRGSQASAMAARSVGISAGCLQHVSQQRQFC
jgi:ferric-dicitrate binding protein FerR (iron transport regulator)